MHLDCIEKIKESINNEFLFSVNLNGDKESVRILVKDDIEEPRAIVMHPGKG